MDALFDGSLGTGSLLLLVLSLVIAFGFEFVNGFHDTANAVATVIYTRSLRPWTAVILSGICNFLGVFIGGIAVALSIINLLPVELLVADGTGAGLAMLLALLLAAIAWNLGTWYFGLPSSSSHTLIGAIVGVGLAFLLQSSDSRVRNIEEVRKIVPYPILGLVMRERKLTSQDVTERFAHQGMFAEAYRSTRTNLQFVDAEGVQRRVLLITSSVPGEGKSTSTLSLALSLAEAGHRVALIDADLRKPRVAEMLGLEDSLGLTDLLVNRVGLEDVMQSVGDNRRLWVLPSGRVPPNPAELLGSPQFEELLTRFKNLFDYVIIDSPPVLPVSDAIVLSRSVDGVLLVAAIETVRRPQLETCVQTLERVGAPVIGVIANRLARTGVDAYSYYGDKAYQSSLAVSTEPAEEPFQSKSSNTESGGSGGREESDAPRSRKRAAREAS